MTAVNLNALRVIGQLIMMSLDVTESLITAGFSGPSNTETVIIVSFSSLSVTEHIVMAYFLDKDR